MVSWVKGIKEDSMSELCIEVLRDVLLPSVYSEARTEISMHKENNTKTVILSSALTPICREMVKSLEMDDFVCSDLEIENGHLTGRPVGKLCFGEEKAVRLLSYCKENNTDPSDVWYYGDSISDLAVLSSVGFPVCVNPDSKLKRQAIKRGWKIVWWS
jgi:HAD superfamily hydrolase (TIGR01490 family)